MPAGERRSPQPASRAEMLESLTESQRVTVERLEGHGWRLCFVRTGEPGACDAIVNNVDMGTHGVVGTDGALAFRPTLRLRRD